MRLAESITISLNDQIRVHATAPGVAEVTQGTFTFRLKHLDPGIWAALRRVADGPATFEELRAAAQAAGEAELAHLERDLNRLAGKRMVSLGCAAGEEGLLRAWATGPLARFSFSRLPEAGDVRLSRFAYVRRTGDLLTIVSPVSQMNVEVMSPEIGKLLVRLVQPCAIADVAGRDAAAGAAAAFLLRAGVLVTADEEGTTDEETDPALAQREFHDVAMHAASRKGLSGSPIGGTYRFAGQIAPSPAIRPPHAGPRIKLARPNLEYIKAHDPPLAQVMESRMSIREHGTEPITVDQLAEFLFRVARVKTYHPTAPGYLYETTRRTSPSGGATHDTELYLVAGQCTGLESAIYHYDPSEHQLTLVCKEQKLVRRLLADAYMANGRLELPQILIVMAARFARLSWKYEGIAYATALKNVGVLYEAMYLAATAMGLAPCGLGSGDSAVFSEAVGVNPMIESSVGEFMLGTRASDLRLG